MELNSSPRPGPESFLRFVPRVFLAFFIVTSPFWRCGYRCFQCSLVRIRTTCVLLMLNSSASCAIVMR